MTVRPPLPAQPLPRDSARIARVAEILACDESDVRRLLDRGELQGFRHGIRGVRVYLDSVLAYQESRAIAPRKPRGAQPKRPPPQRTSASRAAQARAEAELRASGMLP